MVRIAVSDVRLAADEDLCADLVSDIIIGTDCLPRDVDVRIELVELDDVIIQYRAEVGAHCMIERDCDVTSVISCCRNLESL